MFVRVMARKGESLLARLANGVSKKLSIICISSSITVPKLEFTSALLFRCKNAHVNLGTIKLLTTTWLIMFVKKSCFSLRNYVNVRKLAP